MPITLTITHPDPGQTALTGFLQFWARYVRDFDSSKRCQPCLRGVTSRRLRRDSPASGSEIEFSETSDYRHLYICGVGAGPRTERGKRNFHLALKESPGSALEVKTYNGFILTIRNAERLPIPEPLPELAHLGKDHYRCKNFRFGVEYYGYPGLTGNLAQPVR